MKTELTTICKEIASAFTTTIYVVLILVFVGIPVGVLMGISSLCCAWESFWEDKTW